jgi:hypothetical protein
MDPKKVAEAAVRAKSADLNIVVAGEYMMRFRWNDRTDGEDTDRRISTGRFAERVDRESGRFR